MNQFPPDGPLSIPSGPFRIFTKIRGAIRQFMFIAGGIDTVDKLFTGENDTGDNYCVLVVTGHKLLPGVVDNGEYALSPDFH
jgi:hypothetical protein